jgi:hypothetical protein
MAGRVRRGIWSYMHMASFRVRPAMGVLQVLLSLILDKIIRKGYSVGELDRKVKKERVLLAVRYKR